MIIGTAGHIDHGKTSLVRALTGIDVDRLEEEKRRGITIDLGFAYDTLENGMRVGFVDVPGHEKLIHTMVAGAASMDFIMLVIAANDGIMPQTREHIEILSLLGQKRGLVVITCIDLVGVPVLDRVMQDIRNFLTGTFLADAPVFPVSSHTGEGIDRLRACLACKAAAFKIRPQTGRFRFCVDRVFNLKGRGTIVTGSVLSGLLDVGSSVMAAPGNVHARVRSIHAQDIPVETARAGDRAALNLTGDMVSCDVLKRGAMVIDPFLNQPTTRLDVRLKILAGERKPLQQWFPVRFYHAAQNMAARLVFLESESMSPGTDAFVQVVTQKPVIAVTGDRFVLRDTSAMRTIGGGRIIDPQAPQRRRRTAERFHRLAAMEEEDSASALRQLLLLPPFMVDWTVFCRARNLDEETARRILANSDVVRLGFEDDILVLGRQYWKIVRHNIMKTLEVFHTAEPDLPGIDLEKLRRDTAPEIQTCYFRALLDTDIRAGLLKIRGAWIAHQAHEVRLSEKDELIWKRVELILLGDKRFRPPRTRDFARSFSVSEAEMRRILKSVARMGHVYEVAQDYFFPRSVLYEIVGILRNIAAGKPKGEFVAADLRNRLDNGRKIAIFILEFFDRHGLTIRKGDIRRLDSCRLDLFNPYDSEEGNTGF